MKEETVTITKLDIIKLCLVIFVFIPFVVYMFHAKHETDEFLLKHGEVTNATIYRKGVKQIGYTWEFDGKVRRDNDNKPYPIVHKGEIFKLRYNPDNPVEKLLMITQPVFPEGAEIGTTYTENVHIPNPLGKTRAKYTYRVGGREYERWQKIVSDSVDLDKRFTVKYRVDRPEIGYIFFDEQ